MESFLLILIVTVPILSFVGWVSWIIVFGVLAKQAMTDASTVGEFVGQAGHGDLDALLVQLEQSIRAASRGHAEPPLLVGTQNLPPQQATAIRAMFTQAQSEMEQLDALSQQRYESKMADLSGMAASAGIAWSPGPY